MAEKDKSRRPKARIPRGFRDRFGAEIAAEREMLAKISAVYESFGFDPLETPAFEYTDALGKFLPDVDRPNEGVFSLADDDGQWMSLRYDLTAPLARYVAENFDALAKPFRRYAVGPVWRNEKPGPGRYRQFTQCDADTVGAPAPHADAECALMLIEALEAAGLAPDEFEIRISDRRLLSGLLETIGIDSADKPKFAAVMRAMDKLDRLGEPGVRQLLGRGRMDASGDFTGGAGLSAEQIDRIVRFLGDDATSNADTFKRLRTLFAEFDAAHPCIAGLNTLEAIVAQLSAAGISDDRARINLSVIRGLEYYTGPVFEAELTMATTDEKGRPVRLGSVASGGRYDGLVERFKGIEVPAVGVSIGVSRLLAALEMKAGGAVAPQGPIVVLALEDDRMADYQQMAAELRAAGLRAEAYVGGGGMKAQLKYADKRGAPVAIIAGEDERAKGEVIVKDLVRGAELSKQIGDNIEWREGQKAQVSVPRARLVEEVKRAIGENA